MEILLKKVITFYLSSISNIEVWKYIYLFIYILKYAIILINLDHK